jgi:hypothetical protein
MTFFIIKINKLLSIFVRVVSGEERAVLRGETDDWSDEESLKKFRTFHCKSPQEILSGTEESSAVDCNRVAKYEKFSSCLTGRDCSVLSVHSAVSTHPQTNLA